LLVKKEKDKKIEELRKTIEELKKNKPSKMKTEVPKQLLQESQDNN